MKHQVKRVVNEGGDIAFALLEFTAQTSDWFPPLKSAANAALNIAKIVKGAKSQKKDWIELGEYIQNAVACIIRVLPNTTRPSEDVKEAIETLRKDLETISVEIEGRLGRPTWILVREYIKKPDIINDYKSRVDSALKLFQIKSAVTTGIDVSHILDHLQGLDIQGHLERVHQMLGEKIVADIALNARIDKLAYAEGASWDPYKVCLSQTREPLLEEIWAWINDPISKAKVFHLTAPAGAGKTAVAHSVAEQCAVHGILASSFFFSRDYPDRSQKMLPTIARDLAGHDAELRKNIGLAIELDETLLMAPASRQFRDLILKPSQKHQTTKPVVIVIDALDEGDYEKFIHIICDELPGLPDYFRFILTSRAGSNFNSILSRRAHVHSCSIDIDGQRNREDISLAVLVMLEQVKDWKGLRDDWPGREKSTALTARAEGLFLWVITVREYLCISIDPDTELKSLLSTQTADLGAEEKMDELYLTILQRCNWKDKVFTNGYRLLVGAIMAARTPLSASALQCLYRKHITISVTTLLEPLGSVLTGVSSVDHPIRPLHLSFRDFVTTRAESYPGGSTFSIDVKESSQTLALLCLLVLNDDIETITPQLGYLQGDSPGIPKLTDVIVTEQLWYACSFWIDHVVDVEVAEAELVCALGAFLSNHLDSWIELVLLKGRLPNLDKFSTWVQKKSPEINKLTDSLKCAEMLRNVSTRLSYMDRREESLDAILRSVSIYQNLRKDTKSVSSLDLSIVLDELSLRYNDIGNGHGAMDSSKDALQLYEEWARDQPAISPTDVAGLNILINLSNHLHAMGFLQEYNQILSQAVGLFRQLVDDLPEPNNFTSYFANALHTLTTPSYLTNVERSVVDIEMRIQTVVMCRQLASRNPAQYNPDLADALHRLSGCLCFLNDKAALVASLEAVSLRRQLALEHPAKFCPDLAVSLNVLSDRLSHSRNHEKALESCQHAVAIARVLFEERPAAFIQELALYLRNLSSKLFQLGYRHESLEAVRESVELYRTFAMDRPGVGIALLARSMGELTISLCECGYHQEALDNAREAVEISRQLSKNEACGIHSALVYSLEMLAEPLLRLDRLQESRDAISESNDLLRKMKDAQSERLTLIPEPFCVEPTIRGVVITPHGQIPIKPPAPDAPPRTPTNDTFEVEDPPLASTDEVEDPQQASTDEAGDPETPPPSAPGRGYIHFTISDPELFDSVVAKMSRGPIRMSGPPDS